MAAVLQFTVSIMAKQNQNPTPAQRSTQQGDNRKAGDVDGNRGARPQSGSQGVNETAANRPDETGAGGQKPTPAVDNGDRHSEAETLYRDR